jgi:murein DD-endopeptidase MepM/ murein hydrolase activator NlpD
MSARRYVFVIESSASGATRRLSVGLRTIVVLATCALILASTPVLVGLGAKWSASAEIDVLRAQNQELLLENGNFRQTTGELTGQIQSLGGVIDELGARAALDPAQARAMQKLPAIVKARAAGGTAEANASLSKFLSSSLTSPDDTFGVLKNLLQALEGRLRNVRQNVERQERLAAATPSIWPAHGWLTGRFGGRSDPITGDPGFHQGLDISAAKGQPVYATADGVVESAGRNGDYGNLITLQHDFGLRTRYGHLSRFNVKTGDRVQRGDVIGLVGSTGRSTGAHLHYEVRAGDRLMNPLQLLTQPARR